MDKNHTKGDAETECNWLVSWIHEDLVAVQDLWVLITHAGTTVVTVRFINRMTVQILLEKNKKSVDSSQVRILIRSVVLVAVRLIWNGLFIYACVGWGGQGCGSRAVFLCSVVIGGCSQALRQRGASLAGKSCGMLLYWRGGMSHAVTLCAFLPDFLLAVGRDSW